MANTAGWLLCAMMLADAAGGGAAGSGFRDEGVECCSAQAGATITFVFRAHGRISCVCMRGGGGRRKRMNGKKRG